MNQFCDSIRPKIVTNSTTMQQIKISAQFKVNASKHGYRILKLKPFTPYFIKVSECQHLTPALNSSVKCSVIGIERIETLANSQSHI
jgi:hypothetical protein